MNIDLSSGVNHGRNLDGKAMSGKRGKVMKVENREVSGTADPFKGSILEGIFAVEFKLLVEGVKIPETIQEAESLDKSAIKVALMKCVTGQYDKARNAKIKEIVAEMEKAPEKYLNGEKLNQFREVLKAMNKKK